MTDNRDNRTDRERVKVILNFAPEELERIDRWREEHFDGTRTDLFKRALFEFLYACESHHKGNEVLVQHSGGKFERLFRERPGTKIGSLSRILPPRATED